MSSIPITSRLHRSWKQTTELVGENLRTVPCNLPQPPSSFGPPSEEFESILETVYPFTQQGLNQLTFSAIVAASAAASGTPDGMLMPLHYMGGSGGMGPNNTLINWSQEQGATAAYVCTENFPFLSIFPNTVPTRFIPYPEWALNRVVLTGYDNHMILPVRVERRSDIPEEDLPLVHPNELARLSGGITYLKPFQTAFSYTGCIRPATAAEINNLFDAVLTPERWLKLVRLNFSDLFGYTTVNGGSVHEAITLGGTRNVAEPPQAAQATDVRSLRPVAPRRRRGIIVEESDLIPNYPSAPQPALADEIVLEGAAPRAFRTTQFVYGDNTINWATFRQDVASQQAVQRDGYTPVPSNRTPSPSNGQQ